MKFEDELILIIVDKGLLAVVIAITVFILNRLIEKHKSNLDRDNTIVKERFLSINETWKEIYYWIAESNLDYGPKLSFKKETEKERFERIDTILRNGENVMKTVEKNRFINGSAFTIEMITYVAKYYDYYQKVRANENIDYNYYSKLREEGHDLINKHDQYKNLKKTTHN